MKKKVTVLVSNDVTLDKRVDKTCQIWLSEGWELNVIGVLRPQSQPISRAYKVSRINTFFQKGALFYAMLNIRLFFKLSYITTDVIWPNDLDTLLPAFIWSKIRGKQLIYDSHEWFTEAEGLTGRSWIKGFWKILESALLPRIKRTITVNDSIANAYQELYGVKMLVIRNVPEAASMQFPKTKSDWPMPQDMPWIILQGAYIDPDRGAEELVEAVKLLPNVHLIIAGDGRAIPMLKKKADLDRVTFIDKMPYADLMQLTACCDLGLSLDKPMHKNYEFSLPNKIFDYALAGIPVLASPLPEIKRVLLQYNFGRCIVSWEPHQLAKDILSALGDEEYPKWKQNTREVVNHCNWETETQPLREWIRDL